MTVEHAKDYDAMSAVGASILFDEVMRKIAKGERFNLGLATGNTMISLYDQLAEKFKGDAQKIARLERDYRNVLESDPDAEADYQEFKRIISQ